jgi:hypothetical protein
MTEVPKIVYDRLWAAPPERAHPDANLLTAFAEQALSAPESDSVLKHLALCADCREVLVLALPLAEAVTAPIAADTESDRITRISTRTERSWLTVLAGPSMRWAALVAGVVVAASVLLVHPGKLNQPIAPSVNQPAATAALTTVSPTSGSPITSPSTGQVAAKTIDDVRPNSGSLLSKQLSKKQLSKKPDLGENSSAEVSKEAVGVETASSVEGSQMARNDAPVIEKAKPALQQSPATETAGTNEQQKNQPGLAQVQRQTVAGDVIWIIKAGVLQRSVNSGQNWQNALHADHPLLCYASHGEEVWAGGEAGILFHSIDNGITWAQLQPSVKNQKLGADITHIDIYDTGIRGNGSGPARIVVFTSNGETWTSADGGATWQKN